MRLAAFDLGSNSFHLLVADTLHGGRMKRVATRKITLRLGEPVARDGELGRDGRERAATAVAKLVATARDEGASQAVTMATQALRAAADGAKVCERLLDRHGLRVRVLDGMQEGQLSLRGMAGALSLPPEQEILGLDLGGGSYEVMLGGAGPLVAGASLPLGSAFLQSRLRHDPPRFAERAAAHDEALGALAPLAERLTELRPGAQLRAVGTAGTIRDLGRVGLALATGNSPDRVRGVVVTRDQLERGYAWLCSVPTVERMELPGVSEKRSDLLPAGGTVLLATLEAFGLEHLELCDWGLREGAVLDFVGGQEVVSDADVTDL